jgi:hypothetical protein
MTDPAVTPDALRLALERRFRTARVTGATTLVTQFAEDAAEVAMSVVTPVLEARDAEIEKLHEHLSDLVIELRDALEAKGSSEEGERP